MHWTPDDIAASIGNDPAMKAGDILHKYLIEEVTIRFDALNEHFLNYGLDLTEPEMVRLMTIQEDILFTEGADDRGRFWQSSIVPDKQIGPSEGYLDHRITGQYDDAMGQDFDGEEEDFTGRDLAGINSTPEPGQMNNLNIEDGQVSSGPGDPGAFDAQTEPPDVETIDTDQEIPPAMIPRAMPDIVAQAMAPQMPNDNAMEPGIPEPGMVLGQDDQVDMNMPPAQPGPGEEQPAPQTGAQLQMMQPQMMQPGVAQPGVAQPQVVQPQIVPVAQGMVPQQAVDQIEPENDFGDDGADYTIDPFLNALKQATNVEEETDALQSPQTSNTPSTGARTQQDRHYRTAPERYSNRMREAFERRQLPLNE